MAVVLAAAGLFVHQRSEANLDRGVDNALRSRAVDIAALAQQSDSGLSEGGRGAQLAQMIDERGEVLDATAGLPRRPLVPPSMFARVRAGHQVMLGARLPDGTPIRLLAAPVRAQDQQLVVVVGQSLHDRNRALSDLAGVLLVGGPVVLLLASVAAWVLAGSALRPVHEMVARIRASAARERAFVSDASHELRTPLAMVRTELELIARDRPSGAALQRAARSAIEETDRLGRLTDDLLLLSRADHGQAALRTSVTSAAELIGTAAERARRRAPASVRIAVQGGDAAIVSADPDRVGQALDNMIDNAVRHAGSTVELTPRTSDGFVEIHVADDGPGFPPEFLPHAWDRFARADAGRTEDGTGLGLAIVRTIAELHGGQAHARNTPDGGADVWISLPRAR
jgi:signal transduction histidine kinase